MQSFVQKVRPIATDSVHVYQLSDVQIFDRERSVVARVFGHAVDGRTACVEVTGFRPWFYLQVVDGNPDAALAIARALPHVHKVLPERRPQLRGFECDAQGRLKKQLFLRVEAESTRAFYALKKKCSDSWCRSHAQVLFAPRSGSWSYPHQSNVALQAQFIARYGLTFGKWFRVDDASECGSTRCEINLQGSVHPHERELDAPFLTIAYDIEVRTLHRVRCPSTPSKETFFVQIVPASSREEATRTIVEAIERRGLTGSAQCDVRVSYGSSIVVSTVHAYNLQLGEDGDYEVVVGERVISHSDPDVVARRVAEGLNTVRVDGRKCPHPHHRATVTRANHTLTVTLSCTTELRERFPNARDDQIICIGVAARRYGQKSMQRLLLTTAPCALQDAAVEMCPNESALLLRWATLLRQTRPFVLLGYNNSSFDSGYIRDRAAQLLDQADFDRYADISVIPKQTCEIDEFRLSSCAYGDNAMRVFRNVPNFIEGDAYFFVRALRSCLFVQPDALRCADQNAAQLPICQLQAQRCLRGALGRGR